MVGRGPERGPDSFYPTYGVELGDHENETTVSTRDVAAPTWSEARAVVEQAFAEKRRKRRAHRELSDQQYCAMIERETGRWWLYEDERLPASASSFPTARPPRRINGASGRPAARRTASRSATGGSDGDDDPAEPEPPRRRLTLAPRRGIYTYAVLPAEVWR